MNRQNATQTQQQKPSTTFSSSSLLQRQCACGNHLVAGEKCGQSRKNAHTLGTARLSPRVIRNKGAGEAPPIVQEVLRSPGQPLDSATRAFFEPRFGHDFSQVRVHTDARAAEAASAVSASAYTVGSDVVFGAGKYAPWTGAGRQIIAHELVHTFHQTNGAAQSLGAKEISDANDSLEREAGCAAQLLDTGEPPGLFSRGAFQVARQPEEATPEEAESESSPVRAGVPEVPPAIPAEEAQAAPKLDPCKVDAVFVFPPAGEEKAGCRVPKGQHGASALARFRLTGVPPGRAVTVTERFKALDDPYGVISLLKPNTYRTSDLRFDDCYLIASKDPLPDDFVLKVEQNHLLEGKPISKTIITYTPRNVLMRFCRRVKDSCQFSDVCRLK